jgi:hypothetical protein
MPIKIGFVGDGIDISTSLNQKGTHLVVSPFSGVAQLLVIPLSSSEQLHLTRTCNGVQPQGSVSQGDACLL